MASTLWTIGLLFTPARVHDRTVPVGISASVAASAGVQIADVKRMSRTAATAIMDLLPHSRERASRSDDISR